MMRYELHYWPTIQGRGEFVRLALEEAGADYVDVARLTPRQGGGEAALLRRLADKDVAPPPFQLSRLPYRPWIHRFPPLVNDDSNS